MTLQIRWKGRSRLRTTRLRWIAVAWSVACSSEQAPGTPTSMQAAAVEPETAQASANATGAGAEMAPPAASSIPSTRAGAVAGASGGARPSGAKPASTEAVGAPGPALPPDVCGVLQQNGCVSCHQAQLQGGATMALQWQADFTGSARDGTDMASKLLARVKDPAAPMPPQSTQRPLMPQADVEVLQGWIDQGMPGVQGGICDETGAALPDTVPEWAQLPWPEQECEYTLTVGAHGTSGTTLSDDATPYNPPEGETLYHCFYEKVPWGDTPVSALATRVHVESDDDKAIVHHMVVSAIAPEDAPSVLGGMRPTAAGQHYDCPNPSGSTVAVWAPGPHTKVTFPQDVGVLMPSGADAYIEMQVHYNNVTAGRNSRVSVDICATSKPRPNTGAVHWLGYENAVEAVPLDALGDDLQPNLDNQGNGVAVGTCSAKERARVLWMAPHMHEKGRHAKIEIVRTDGNVEVVHDAPFSFTDQTAFFFDNLWLDAGDKVRTTCTWDNSSKIVFGFGSKDEMCFMYTLAYPVGALKGEGAEFGVVGGNLSCAGSP